MLQEDKHEWIGAYIDGELSPSDQRMVEQWLDGEPECRRLHDELLDLRRQLQQVRVSGPEAQLGRDLASAIMAEIDIAEPDWRPTPQVGAAAATGWSHVATRLLTVAAAVALVVFWALQYEKTEHSALVGDGQAGQPTLSNDPGNDNGVQDLNPQPTEMLVAARPASFIVVEIELTRKGLNRDSVNNALRQAGIGIANGIPVAADLESALMESRFFNPPENAKNKKPNDEDGEDEKGREGPKEPQLQRAALDEMIYCVMNGPQIDTVWEYIAAEKGAGAVTQFNIDVAFLENDLSLFQMLHNSAELQLAAADRSSKSKDSLRLRAQRVLLTTAMQTKLGMGLRVLSAPTLGLLNSVLKGQAGEAAANNKANGNVDDNSSDTENDHIIVNATEAQKREMASKSTGILFVVRTQTQTQGEDANGNDK